MEETKLQDAELEKVAGGIDKDGWATVTGLHKGFLALRTQAGYNGDRLKICGGCTTGFDGETYVWVYNPRTEKYGWTNARYLR